MNHWNQTERLPRWIVVPTIALIALGGSLALAQPALAQPEIDQPESSTSQSELEISAPSEFKQLSRFGSSAQAPASDEARTKRLEQSQSPVTSHRINSIHERIELIKRLMREEKADAQAAKQENLLDFVADAKSPGETQPADPKQSGESPEATEPPVATTDPESAPNGSGTPVVSHPVNPIELANSLFATGNIAASRRSYEAGLVDAKPEDRLWIKCLIGCCYRLEGDFAKAETTFREVTTYKKFAYPVDYAKWCLKYLEQRRSSAEQFNVIEMELENILKELSDRDGS